MTREQHLASIRLRIELAERGEKHRLHIKELERQGQPTDIAKDLLKAFERALQAHYETHSKLMRREAAPRLALVANRSRHNESGAEA